jgi:hypothetical protein
MTVMTTGPRYTHRDWRYDIGTVLTEVAGIVQDLAVMEASLGHVQAGRTHLTLVRGCAVTGAEILRDGLQFIEATDVRYLPVHEAIQAAGGQDEVAKTKTYHTAG